MTETIDQLTEDDNPIEDQPGAILIKDDPTGQTAIRFEWVTDLSDADYERFSEAVNALHDIHGSNLFAYVRQAGLELVRTVGDAYNAIYENRISHVQPDDIEEWSVRLRTAVLGMCSSIHHHQEPDGRRGGSPPRPAGDRLRPRRRAFRSAT
jgi:hypothetical protein